jgi:hypothetical protein
MFVTSVGIGGPTTVDNAGVFVRQIGAGPKPAQVIVKISTAHLTPANTSFHFLLIYFHPIDPDYKQGIEH